MLNRTKHTNIQEKQHKFTQTLINTMTQEAQGASPINGRQPYPYMIYSFGNTFATAAKSRSMLLSKVKQANLQTRQISSAYTSHQMSIKRIKNCPLDGAVSNFELFMYILLISCYDGSSIWSAGYIRFKLHPHK